MLSADIIYLLLFTIPFWALLGSITDVTKWVDSPGRRHPCDYQLRNTLMERGPLLITTRPLGQAMIVAWTDHVGVVSVLTLINNQSTTSCMRAKGRGVFPSARAYNCLTYTGQDLVQIPTQSN